MEMRLLSIVEVGTPPVMAGNTNRTVTDRVRVASLLVRMDNENEGRKCYLYDSRRHVVPSYTVRA